MEICLFQTGSSYNYAVEWDICEIPALKPMVMKSSNIMDIGSLLLIIIDNGKYPEMEIGLFQTASISNFGPITDTT